MPKHKAILIIIGAGVSGISTCYHASKRLGEEYSEIICYDDGNPLAASRDKHKIIRYDYADIQTMEKALESYNTWQTDPHFSGFFKKMPRLVIYRKQDETYRQIKANREALQLKERRILSASEVLRNYGLHFAEESLIIFNEDDALVRLGDCIGSIRDTCEKRGIKFINEHIEKISFEDEHFSGVAISGRQIKYPGGKVVVSCGASFPELQEKSNMPLPPRMSMCVQIFAFNIQLAKPCKYPIISEIGKGEFFHETEDFIKLTWIRTYTQFAPVDDSKTFLALQCMLQATQWLSSVAPDTIGFKITRIASYADGLILGENPMIAKLPTDPNTVVIHGLSYTNAKRLPDLGLEVMSVVDGLEIHTLYGWNMSQCPEHYANQPSLRPEGTFEYLNEQAKVDPEVIEWQMKHPEWREGSDILFSRDNYG